MARVILKEFLIFVGCLSLFPLMVLVVLFYSDAWNMGRAFLSRELFTGGRGPGGTSFTLWIRLVSPYLAVQAIRAFLWSQRSIAGKKWGNLYLSILMAAVGGWSLAQAWDLFYFMYALGDIPGELVQFFKLETSNLLVAISSLALAVYCFSIFLHPSSSPRSKGSGRVEPE